MVRRIDSNARANVIVYLACFAALAGTGAYIAAPPPALATVTSSTLTQPVDGTRLIVDDQSAPSTVHVAGTTNGLSSDTVKLLCDEGTNHRAFFGPDIGVAFDGSFSADIPLSTFYTAGGACFLRAVPSDLNAYGGADASPYQGRKLTVDLRRRITFATGPSTGKSEDFLVLQQGAAAENWYLSIADSGLGISKLFYPSTFTESEPLWSGNAEVAGQEGGTPDRSFLKVDGRNAIASGADVRWGDQTHAQSLPGLDPVVYSYSSGPGALTIHETDHFDRCATASDPTWPPATMSSCPSFQRTGVRVDRAVTQGMAGKESTIVDSWRSEDGRRHDLDLHYNQIVRNPPTYGHIPSYAFPWVSPAYSTHVAGDVVPAPPSAPASWLVSVDSAAPDGSTLLPQGALTFDPRPDAMVFRASQDALLRYHRTIPAGGTLVITQVFDMATTRAAVGSAALAARNRLALSPVLSRVSLAAASFSAGRGTTLRLTLSKPATVDVAVDQKLRGRKSKGRCRPKARRGKRCTLEVRRAKFTYFAGKGADAFAFRTTKLKLGAYVAAINARDVDGRLSKPVRLNFKIK